MPPDTATPEEVARADVDAVHAGDGGTADALVNGVGQSWYGSVEITALSVTKTTQEKRATESGDGPEIERVWVDLTSRGGDVSLPDEHHVWSYLLDGTGPQHAWRIYDQGMG